MHHQSYLDTLNGLSSVPVILGMSRTQTHVLMHKNLRAMDITPLAQQWPGRTVLHPLKIFHGIHPCHAAALTSCTMADLHKGSTVAHSLHEYLLPPSDVTLPECFHLCTPHNGWSANLQLGSPPSWTGQY